MKNVFTTWSPYGTRTLSTGMEIHVWANEDDAYRWIYVNDSKRDRVSASYAESLVRRGNVSDVTYHDGTTPSKRMARLIDARNGEPYGTPDELSFELW